MIPILGFSFVLGCAISTKDIQPQGDFLTPPVVSTSTIYSIEQLRTILSSKHTDQNLKWWAQFKLGQMQAPANTACEHFGALAKNNQFPLRYLSLVKAYEVCTKDQVQQLELSELDTEELPKWLEDQALDVALSYYDKNKILDKALKLHYKKSKQNMAFDKKIHHTQVALSYAKKLNDSSYQNLLENRLYRLSPKLNPKKQTQSYLKIANEHRRDREFKQAEKYYKKMIYSKNFSFEEKVQAFKGLALSHKLNRDKEASLDVEKKLSQFIYKFFIKDPNNYAKKYYHQQIRYARAMWTLNYVSDAKKLLMALEGEVKNHVAVTDIYWLLGRMAEEKKHFKQAITWFKKGLNTKDISDYDKEKLNWYLGWNYRKVNDFVNAQKAFEGIINLTSSSFDRSRYLYWLGRTYQDLKLTDKANEIYTSLIEEDQLGYYGILAHREQGIKLKQKSLPERGLATKSKLKFYQTINTNYVHWLMTLNETQVANEYLNFTARRMHSDSGYGAQDWLQLFNYFEKMGNHLSIFDHLYKIPGHQRAQLLSEKPNLLFPRPYYDVVVNSGERYNVAPEFIYSIMRQESAFDPAARSHADAFGLMQLLPELAEKNAGWMQLPYQRFEDLYKPSINIALGAAHLRELFDKYNGMMIPTIASYNASESAIRGWLQTRFRGDSIEFIEDIPYEETKTYVRLVLRNFVYYQLLNSESLAIGFPEWTLRLEKTSS